MSRFDTLGFSDLGTGDGVLRDFPIAGKDESVTDFAVESVRRDGWQGQVLMSPIPRTNYASYSNDFTRPEWNGSPSLLLGFKDQRYFVVDSSGALQQKPFSDIITFTRASGGGRFNAQGQYEWLPANQPRIDYDPVTGECLGLLIEEQRTNLLLQSSDLSKAPWSKQAASVTFADGISTIVEGITTDIHWATQISNTAVATQFTFEVDVKPYGRNFCRLVCAGTTATFNLLTGAISSATVGPDRTYSARPIGDGWWRLRMTVPAGAGNIQSYVQTAISATSFNYLGDGISGIQVRRCDLQPGAFPTSHIPTTTAQVTRAADIASVNELSPWYNPEQGTLYVEADFTPGVTSNQYAATLGDNGFQNFIAVRRVGDGTRQAVVTVGGVDMAIFSSGPGTNLKAALAFKANQFQAAFDGTASVVDTSGSLPVVNRLLIGRLGFAGLYANGHIRVIRVYPRAMPDQLQALTA